MFTHLFVLNRKYGIQAHCTNTKIKTKNWKGEETNMERADRRKKRRFFNVQNGTNRENPVFYIGLSSDYMAFFASAINILQTLVVAIGAGLAVWGVINLLEGYGNDNPGANAHVR